MRGNMYVTERLRMVAEKQHASKEDFLRSLGLELTLFEDDSTSLARLAQLTEKTNQFNTHKQPFTEADIQGFIANPDASVFYAKLSDKFGEYGIILFALVEKSATTWHIRSLLMSCRVFGRGVEDAFLVALMEKALAAGVQRITIAFEASPKNAPAQEFVERHFTDNARASLGGDAPDWIKII